MSNIPYTPSTLKTLGNSNILTELQRINKFTTILSLLTMKKNSSIGLSIPNELIQKIDSEWGDVSRSRFLLRPIQRAYLLQEKEEEEENGGSF